MTEPKKQNRNRSRRWILLSLGMLLVVGALAAPPAAASPVGETRTQGGDSGGLCVLPIGPAFICVPEVRQVAIRVAE